MIHGKHIIAVLLVAGIVYMAYTAHDIKASTADRFSAFGTSLFIATVI